MQDRNSFDSLPKEIMIHLFSYLGTNEIFALLLTSKKINQVADDNYIWFNLFSKSCLTHGLESTDYDFKAVFSKYREEEKSRLDQYRLTLSVLKIASRNREAYSKNFLYLLSNIINHCHAKSDPVKISRVIAGGLIFARKSFDTDFENKQRRPVNFLEDLLPEHDEQTQLIYLKDFKDYIEGCSEEIVAQTTWGKKELMEKIESILKLFNVAQSMKLNK